MRCVRSIFISLRVLKKCASFSNNLTLGNGKHVSVAMCHRRNVVCGRGKGSEQENKKINSKCLGIRSQQSLKLIELRGNFLGKFWGERRKFHGHFCLCPNTQLVREKETERESFLMASRGKLEKISARIAELICENRGIRSLRRGSFDVKWTIKKLTSWRLCKKLSFLRGWVWKLHEEIW